MISSRIQRFRHRIRQQISLFSVIAFALVLFALISMGWGVSEAVRGWRFEMVWPIVVSAFLLGWLLAKLGLKWYWGILVGVLAGLLSNYFVVGQLADEFAELWYQMRFVVNTWFDEYAQTNLYRVNAAFEDIWFDGVFMSQRVIIWLRGFPRPPVDPVATMLVWGFGLWLSGMVCGWFLARHQHPVGGLLPAIAMLGVSRSLASLSAVPVYPLLVAGLGAMVLLKYQTQEDGWRKREIGFSHLIRQNTIWAGFFLTLGLVVFSGFTATVDWDDIIDRLREPEQTNTAKARAAEALGVERTLEEMLPEEIFGRMTFGGLPTQLLVGSGPELADQVVMYIEMEEINRATGTLRAADGDETYYMRSLTFDRYTNRGWSSNTGNVHSYSADQPAIREYSANQLLLHQKVIRVEPYTSLVYAAGELAVVDAVYRIAYRARNSGGMLVDEFGALVEGERSYEAFSVMPDYGEDELRTAGQAAPDWVLERYLQLPDTVPQRVLDLAFEITLGESTAYDRAVAIEQYLRQFPYTLDLPERVAGRDLVDYFLFDLQRGYCDYYASSMVVMARSVGLPARLATGYIVSTYDEDRERYIVTGDEAHSWVEIYFPEYGWVTFEPTAGRAPIARIIEREDVGEFTGQVMAVPEIVRFQLIEFLRWLGISLLIGSVLGLLLWAPVDRLWLKGQKPEAVLARLYRRMQRFGRWLGAGTRPAHTPHEFLTHFEVRWAALGFADRSPWLWDKLLMRVQRIVKQCESAAYLPDAPKETERMLAIATWAQMRWPLLAASLLVRLQYTAEGNRRVNVKKKFRNG